MKSTENELIAEFYKLLKIAENELQNIKLNDTENKIFNLFLAVANNLPQKPTLRVAAAAEMVINILERNGVDSCHKGRGGCQSEKYRKETRKIKQVIVKHIKEGVII